MGAIQIVLPGFGMPNWLHCETHGDYDPRAYYSEREMLNDLKEQGFIDCPMCLAEIAGGEIYNW